MLPPIFLLLIKINLSIEFFRLRYTPGRKTKNYFDFATKGLLKSGRLFKNFAIFMDQDTPAGLGSTSWPIMSYFQKFDDFKSSSDYYCREKCAKCIPRSLLSHSETSIVYLSKSDRRVGIVIGWSRNLGLFSVGPSTFSKTQILKVPIRYRAGLGKPDRPKSMKNLKF